MSAPAQQRQYDLQFYENRSTPQVLTDGEPPKPKKNYGNPTSRRPVSDSERRVIERGGWVRVDEAGNTPRSPDYKKTAYRPWLVNVNKSAFGVDHGSISKAMAPNNVAIKLSRQLPNKIDAKASERFARIQEARRLANTAVKKDDSVSAFGVVHKGVFRGAIKGAGGLRGFMKHPISNTGRTIGAGAAVYGNEAAKGLGKIPAGKLKHGSRLKHATANPGHAAHKFEDFENNVVYPAKGALSSGGSVELLGSALTNGREGVGAATRAILGIKGYPVG